MLIPAIACLLCGLIPFAVGLTLATALRNTWPELSVPERLFYAALITLCIIALASVGTSAHAVFVSTP